MTEVFFRRSEFGEKERLFLKSDGIKASTFRYDTGVEAVRLTNSRGWVIVLPYLGQMLWDANFDGVKLGMGHNYPAPRPAKVISDAGGCLSYHAGLLRNGCPSPEDDHVLHGEFPCAELGAAGLEIGSDEEGGFVRVTGEYEHLRGFGVHYMGRPSLTVRPDSSLFDIGMVVENRSGAPMDLMYNCHANFAFVENAHIIQPAPFTPENVTVRTAIPSHIPATPAYRAMIEELSRKPGRTEFLDPSLSYDPEQVFFLSGLRCDAQGRTHVMMRKPEGDGFAVSFSPKEFPHPARALMRGVNAQAAGFAMPATCRPEGYTAERRAGRVRSLAPESRATFRVRLGYLDRPAAEAFEALILSL